MNKIIRGLLFIGIFIPSLGFTQKSYPFTERRQEAQFIHLLKELRCLVCQNQDLADSNANLAKDLREEVYQFVLSGKSDQEIMDYLTERYGDFIRFSPPLKLITYLLWFGPILFLMMGFFIFWNTCIKDTT